MQDNILITGGSSGIGYALVNKFITNNYHVYAVGRNITLLKKLAEQHTNLTIIKVDITEINGRNSILDTLKEVKNLDIINNAAYGNPQPFKTLAMADLRAHFETNFFAPVELLQRIIAEHKVDKVLNVSSGAAKFPLISLLAYCSSKAAIHHAMSCLELEYPNTKFANLGPGMVDTLLRERWRGMGEEIFPEGNFYVQAKAQGKLNPPTLVADFIYWVMSHTTQEFAREWDINDITMQQFWRV